MAANHLESAQLALALIDLRVFDCSRRCEILHSTAVDFLNDIVGFHAGFLSRPLTSRTTVKCFALPLEGDCLKSRRDRIRDDSKGKVEQWSSGNDEARCQGVDHSLEGRFVLNT